MKQKAYYCHSQPSGQHRSTGGSSTGGSSTGSSLKSGQSADLGKQLWWWGGGWEAPAEYKTSQFGQWGREEEQSQFCSKTSRLSRRVDRQLAKQFHRDYHQHTGEVGVVWVVPSFMKGQQKLVNALIASLSRRLPVPDTRLGEGEFTTGDNVMAWWEEDRCWFRAIGCWRHTQTSPPLSSSWTGGTQSSCHLDK